MRYARASVSNLARSESIAGLTTALTPGIAVAFSISWSNFGFVSLMRLAIAARRSAGIRLTSAPIAVELTSQLLDLGTAASADAGSVMPCNEPSSRSIVVATCVTYLPASASLMGVLGASPVVCRSAATGSWAVCCVMLPARKYQSKATAAMMGSAQ